MPSGVAQRLPRGDSTNIRTVATFDLSVRYLECIHVYRKGILERESKGKTITRKTAHDA